MKKVMTMVTGIVVAMFMLTAQTEAQDGLLESLVKACEPELTTYCSTVTPGNNRILACIYAYQDQLSGQCEYALYDASVQLERAVAAMSYVISECSGDVQNLCSGVAQGEGRLVSCLNDNESDVSPQCTRAMTDTGLK